MHTLTKHLSTLSLLLLLSQVHAEEATEAPVSKPAPRVVEKVAHAVKRGASAAATGIEHGIKAAAHGIERGAKAAARGIEHGAQATGKAAHRVADKIGGASQERAPATAPGAPPN